MTTTSPLSDSESFPHLIMPKQPFGHITGEWFLSLFLPDACQCVQVFGIHTKTIFQCLIQAFDMRPYAIGQLARPALLIFFGFWEVKLSGQTKKCFTCGTFVQLFKGPENLNRHYLHAP